jgi:hypothetical protein
VAVELGDVLGVTDGVAVKVSTGVRGVSVTVGVSLGVGVIDGV